MDGLGMSFIESGLENDKGQYRFPPLAFAGIRPRNTDLLFGSTCTRTEATCKRSSLSNITLRAYGRNRLLFMRIPLLPNV